MTINITEHVKESLNLTDGGAIDQAPTNDANFRQVQIFFHGIDWPNGQDLGPDTVAAELVETEDSAV